MTLDVHLAAAVRATGATALQAYGLTPLESHRLVEVAREPGMELNCTLARGNRFAPIVEMFPLTCELLKSQLRSLLEELWSRHRPDNYQLAGEEDAFAELLEQKCSRGELASPYVEEIFNYERTCLELARSLRYVAASALPGPGAEPFRFARFAHDPGILVPALERRETPPPDLPASDYVVRITLRGDALHVDLVDCPSV